MSESLSLRKVSEGGERGTHEIMREAREERGKLLGGLLSRVAKSIVEKIPAPIKSERFNQYLHQIMNLIPYVDIPSQTLGAVAGRDLMGRKLNPTERKINALSLGLATLSLAMACAGLSGLIDAKYATASAVGAQYASDAPSYAMLLKFLREDAETLCVKLGLLPESILVSNVSMLFETPQS